MTLLGSVESKRKKEESGEYIYLHIDSQSSMGARYEAYHGPSWYDFSRGITSVSSSESSIFVIAVGR